MNPERRAEIEAFAAGGGRDMRALTETLAALAEAERERDTVRTDTHDALAAAEARAVLAGEGQAPECIEDRHIVLPSGEACVCGENRSELLL